MDSEGCLHDAYDLLRRLPASLSFEGDIGPYICMPVCRRVPRLSRAALRGMVSPRTTAVRSPSPFPPEARC